MMLRITRKEIMNKIQKFLMSLCKLTVCPALSMWCAALPSPSQKEHIVKTGNGSEGVNKDNQRYGAAFLQGAVKQSQSFSARKGD